MTVHHHLDHATVVRYASGDLDEAFSVIVASHLAMCPTCREATRHAEMLGGDLLEQIDGATVGDDVFEGLMTQIEAAGPAEPMARQTPAIEATGHAGKSDVPKPLQRFIGQSLDAIAWRTVAPGLRRHIIDLPSSGNSSSLYLLWIAAGKAVPEHGHGGTEMTLVLSGKFRDSMGVFGPGDIEDLDENIEHQPRVEPGAPCICLVATQAPTRFKGFFSRLLQPLVGI
ncbi:MAG: ChrR family anti-sigma-E factor [Rhizobiaceae bacterium]